MFPIWIRWTHLDVFPINVILNWSYGADFSSVDLYAFLICLPEALLGSLDTVNFPSPPYLWKCRFFFIFNSGSQEVSGLCQVVQVSPGMVLSRGQKRGLHQKWLKIQLSGSGWLWKMVVESRRWGEWGGRRGNAWERSGIYCQVMVVLEILEMSLTLGLSVWPGLALADHTVVVITWTSAPNWDSSPEKNVLMSPIQL